MKTLAVWYTSKEEDVDVKLDVHINFWRLEGKKTKNSLLDLGFLIYDISKLDTLNIHFPFDLDLNDIEDLGEKFRKDQKLVNSIFNENYEVHIGTEPKQLSVQENGKTIFNIYSLDFSQSDCILDKPKWDGTLLSVDLSSIDILYGCSKYYFRFRLKGKVLEYFRRKHIPKLNFFQSAFTATEIIEFRLNEKRNYQISLSEAIKRKNEFRIVKIHFLLMRKSDEDFESNHIKATCRFLEPNLWSYYVGKEYDLKDIVAYHWSEKKEDGDKFIDSFNTLAKVKYHNENWLTIGKYFLYIAGLAIFFNIISGVIINQFGLFKNSPSTTESSPSSLEKPKENQY